MVRDKILSEMVGIIQILVEASDTKRILERIIKHNNELFLFLDHLEVEPTNNRAERHLRPNVIMRKITFGNGSAWGAEKHQIIMSIIQTGILNGIEPLKLFLALTLGYISFLLEIDENKGTMINCSLERKSSIDLTYYPATIV